MGREGQHGFRAPLDRERERAIVVAAANGDQKARDGLVEAFMPLIGGAARPYMRARGMDQTEVIQEGVIGLLEAARRYDPDLGTPFWAYAVWWVRRGMQRFAAQTAGPIVLSDAAVRKLAAVRAARRQLNRAGVADPSSDELAAVTGLSCEETASLLAADGVSRGFDEPVGAGDDTSLSESIADPTAQDPYERVARAAELLLLGRLTDGLGERERLVIRSRYGLGRPAETLREVGDGLNLSAERVRQIEDQALTKLRDAFEAAAGPAHSDRPRARRGCWPAGGRASSRGRGTPEEW